MNFPKLIIETNENYKETSIFPWLPKSETYIKILYDAIPMTYLDKLYFITLAFPYNSENIYLEHENNFFHARLIHSSDELNLALYTCNDYEGFTYTINDLKYKIPADKFTDFAFNCGNELVKINHIDYYFKNLSSDYLPPMAYLKCQSESAYIGSVLFNNTTKSIYGILFTTYEDHIVIPSIAIKRLLDGINTDFKYSNFYCDYNIYNNTVSSGIKIINTFYDTIKPSTIILDINNSMIINGKIKYSKINEWVPIEVYMWYEWLPNTNINLTVYTKGYKNTQKSLPFINFKDMLNIPFRNINPESKIMKLSYELMQYFYDKNVILSSDKIDEYLSNPFKKIKLEVDVKEDLIAKKYAEPTEESVSIVS
jgi:hypothetical protein